MEVKSERESHRDSRRAGLCRGCAMIARAVGLVSTVKVQHGVAAL